MALRDSWQLNASVQRSSRRNRQLARITDLSIPNFLHILPQTPRLLIYLHCATCGLHTLNSFHNWGPCFVTLPAVCVLLLCVSSRVERCAGDLRRVFYWRLQRTVDEIKITGRRLVHLVPRHPISTDYMEVRSIFCDYFVLHGGRTILKIIFNK
jgi:hypothetical protein